MSLSKYPSQLDMFQYKRNALFDGDPNGDSVMAEDVNELQDAILEIEKSLGLNPQGSHLNVGERITLLEGSSSLRVPSFLLYLGNPNSINGATDIASSVNQYLKHDHIVLAWSEQNNANIVSIIDSVKSNKEVHFYGYIDCSVTTANLSISQIQVLIQKWKDIGATGIYCKNFGFEKQVSRERQNLILDSIHQYKMSAILEASNPDEVLSDVYHATLNPNWVAPNIERQDTYHYNNFVIDTSTESVYQDFVQTISQLKKLYSYRKELGIRIFATPLIRTNTTRIMAQKYYDYAHTVALLSSVDAFHPVVEGYGEVVNQTPIYDWVPIVGNWYVNAPTINVLDGIYSRETSFGKIEVNSTDHTYAYEGLYIPYELLRIAANTIEGNLLKDNSIEDVKIKNYSGPRLINAINADATVKINVSKIMDLSYNNIEGDVPASKLSANVIAAINAYVGAATIGEAFIGDLHAEKITAGSLNAGRMSASVVSAINMYSGNAEIGNAYIHGAIVDKLNAASITAGDIDAARIKVNIIDAINLSANQANIQNLNATNITSGDISSDRIQTNVINAINAYIDSGVANKMTIKAAAIGQLTANHIKATVIEAINASIESITIDSAKISALTANHIKANVIEAINANLGLAAINGAVIEEGTVGSLQITNGSITNAKINDLDAGKITAGIINSSLVKIQGDNGFLRLWGNRLQVFDNQAVPVERVAIGDVNNDGTTFGLRVRGSDGITVLYDEKGVYNEGITDGAITNLKIGTDAVDGRVIKAESIFAEHVVAGEIKSAAIATDAIITRHILAGSITAASGIIADAAIGTAQIASAVIEDGHIKSLNADKIIAGKIRAEFVEIGATTTFALGYDPVAINNSLREDLRLTAALPTAITMNGDGIKATTPGDLTKYVSLDYRGLYISNGAIIIDGGLSKENISTSVTDDIDNATSFIADTNNDSVITISEKSFLKRDWDGYVAEHATIISQSEYYWPTGITAPDSENIYLTKYNELDTFLHVGLDLNNAKPILDSANLTNNSQIDGVLYNSKILEYKNAKYALLRDVAQKAKDLADAAQQKANEIENNVTYEIDILSSNGVIFKNGNINTVLEARVYHGANDITDTILASKIIWTRTSQDPAGDVVWNNAHSTGTKTITITSSDVNVRATFSCKLLA